MRKHIKLHGELSADGKSVKVTVLGQTHRCEGFGVACADRETHIYARGTKSFRFWDLRIISAVMPNSGFRSNIESIKYVFLRGSEVESDLRSFDIPLELWKPLKSTVQAYNEYFKE